MVDIATKLYLLCSIGKPSPAEFRSAPFSRAKDTYNLTWLVESYPALDEVRLLYRKVMVSSLYGLTFWLVLNKSSHQKSSSRQSFLVNLLLVFISKLNLSQIKIKSLKVYHSVFVYRTQPSPNILFDTMILLSVMRRIFLWWKMWRLHWISAFNRQKKRFVEMEMRYSEITSGSILIGLFICIVTNFTWKIYCIIFCLLCAGIWHLSFIALNISRVVTLLFYFNASTSFFTLRGLLRLIWIGLNVGVVGMNVKLLISSKWLRKGYYCNYLDPNDQCINGNVWGAYRIGFRHAWMWSFQ